MAIDLLLGTNRPAGRAYTADPLTIAEIDAHPAGDRIWATIIQMRDAHDTQAGEIIAEERQRVGDWEAEREDYVQDIEDLRDEIADMESQLAELRDALSQFGEAA